MMIRCKTFQFLFFFLILLIPQTGVCQQEVTVEDLYARILANHEKIQDLKMKVFIQETGLKNQRKEIPSEVEINPYFDGVTQEFWYKAPDLRMWIVDGRKEDVFTADTQISRRFTDGAVEEQKIEPSDFTVNPVDPTFYKYLVDYLRKYEVVQIVGHPEPDIYVIKAVPSSSHPEDLSEEGMYLEITIDYSHGLLQKMVFLDPLTDNKVTRGIVWGKIEKYSDVNMALKISMTTNYYERNAPYPLEDVSEMNFAISDVQINTETVKAKDFTL